MTLIMRRWTAVATASAAALAAAAAQLTPATAWAQNELHNITYIARVDGVAPGSQAKFRVNGNEIDTVNLSAVPGNAFEAHEVLADPKAAGMQVLIHWPYSANVHCEIDVDDNVATKVDQLVSPQPGNGNPMNGVLACGAPLT